jgi:hypothetical protein
MRRYIELILSTSMMWFSVQVPASWAQDTQSYIPPIEVRQKVAKYTKAIDKLSERIDERHFSVDAMADALDYEIQAAVEFVENKISYDPYLGVMRGPEGTLSTEAGSAWDQAVLLAALINAMGGEAMLAIGRLPDDEALGLLARGIASTEEPSNALVEMDVDRFIKNETNVDNLADHAAAMSNAVGLDEYEAATRKIVARLIAQLKAEGAPLASPSAEAASSYARQLGDDYVWVHYRDLPSDPWTDVHPVFGSEIPPAVEAERYIESSVPDEKLHKIELQFHIEVTTDGKAKRVSVSDKFSRPAANLSSMQLKVGISPDTVDPEKIPNFYTPVLGEAFAPGALSFNMFGQTVDPVDASAGPAIFATVAKKLGGALDGLSDDESAAPRLTGTFLTVSRIGPGGQRHEEVRRLTDLRDFQGKNSPYEITTSGTLEVNVGVENGARNMRDLLRSTQIGLRRLPVAFAVIAEEVDPEALSTHPTMTETMSHDWPMALALDGIFNRSVRNGRLVQTAPIVLFKRQIVRPNGDLVLAVDIQHNPQEGFTLGQGGVPITAPEMVFRQGVFTTLVEGELINVSSIRDWHTEDDMRLVESEDALTADPIWAASSSFQKERLVADLDFSGHLMIPNNQQTNWWRVDPSSGHVLGMGIYGGAEFTEEMTLMEAIPTAVTGFFVGYGLVSGGIGCAQQNGSASYKACCMAGVAVLTGIAYAAGTKLTGPLTAGLGAIMSLSFDLATGLPGSPVTDAANDLNTLVCESMTTR